MYEIRREIVMSKIGQVLTSLEVSQMVGKDHSKLLRDIRKYSEQLGEAKIGLSDFFTEIENTSWLFEFQVLLWICGTQ